jgi:hypothetical protein
MFSSLVPQMPQEIIDAVQADPGAFGEAMGSGMDAFAAAMESGGGMSDAFDAMGDAMGPMFEEMGVSPELFEAAGDLIGAAVGPAMIMGPSDAGGPEMGAIMQDAATMMMPEGETVPDAVMDAMMDMGQGMADAGCGPHDAANEMMAPPGEPGYPLPLDGAGEPVVIPGDPASCPAEACQPPPADGAMADAGMMPPPDGYDHSPMGPDMQMPEPMTLEIAMGDQGADAADAGSEGAGGAEGAVFSDQVADAADAGSEGAGGAEGDGGGMDALDAALGGGDGSQPNAPDGEGAGSAMDSAIGTAMDGAMEQGGAPGGDGSQPNAPEDESAGLGADDGPQNDDTAGMGG